MSNQDKINELFKLSLAVNMQTGFCVFVRMSGHVDNIEFDVMRGKNGQDEWGDDIYCNTLYYQGDCDFDNDYYDKTKIFLQKLLDGHYPKQYKAVLDFGITKVSKTFNSEKERDIWLEDAKSKSKIPPEVFLTEMLSRDYEA